MNLIHNLIKNKLRVIVFDLTGHNCVSNIYRKTLVKNNSSSIISIGGTTGGNDIPEENTIFELDDNFFINDKYENSIQEYYDFNTIDGSCFLSTILNDYGLLNNKDANVFILGHSIGSLFIFSSLIKSLGSWSNSDENFIKGVISLSPNLKDLRFDNMIFYNILSLFWPGFNISNRLSFDEKDKFILNDIGDKKFTARSINYILLLQNFIFNNHAYNITVPNLFFHSKDDKVSSYEHSLEFFNKINSEKKEFIGYELNGHNLFIGDKCEEISNKINSWINNILI
jgi:esterase/lipase